MRLKKKILNLFKKEVNSPSTNYAFGSPIPAPPEVKRLTIFNYAKSRTITTLIETGTFHGDTIKAAFPFFNEIISIEVDYALAKAAKLRFQGERKVTIIQGDSGREIKQVLKSLKTAAIFWLDGHYSGGVTGKADKNTPIIDELTSILTHSVKDHVILIDDARCFSGEYDYPTLFEIYEMVKGYDMCYKMNVKDDIIRIGYDI